MRAQLFLPSLPGRFNIHSPPLSSMCAGRKQGDESPEVFKDVMGQIADALIAAAAALLSPGAAVGAGCEWGRQGRAGAGQGAGRVARPTR